MTPSRRPTTPRGASQPAADTLFDVFAPATTDPGTVAPTKPGQIPAHVLAHLATRDGIDYTTVARKARRHPCRHCHTWCWRALDDDWAALDALADDTPLTPIGEVTALLSSLTTYRIGVRGGRPEMDRRDSWHIDGEPAGTLFRADIIPAHRCGMTWPTNCRAPRRFPTPATADPEYGDPPF